MQIFTNTKPTAKKEHKCDWCYEKINKSEKYHRQDGLADGEAYTNKFHPECWTAFNDWCKLEGVFYDVDYWIPGSFQRGTVKDKFDNF